MASAEHDYGYIPDPGERTLRVIHRAAITLVPAVVGAFALAALAIFFLLISSHVPTTVPFGSQITHFLAALLAIIAVATVLIAVFVYNRNVLIFTNFHLIQSEQLGLFNHRISQVDFRRVQDVSGRKVGIWQTIFNFGSVEVQSASEQEKFIFDGATNPAKLADEALQTRDICLHELAIHDGLGTNSAVPTPSVQADSYPAGDTAPAAVPTTPPATDDEEE